MTSVNVIVTGRVQGVGFRWFVHDLAEDRGVTGWVRNRRDGSVEAELHGDEVQIDAMIHAMRHGPRHGRVDALEVRELPPQKIGGFEILPTK